MGWGDWGGGDAGKGNLSWRWGLDRGVKLGGVGVQRGRGI